MRWRAITRSGARRRASIAAPRCCGETAARALALGAPGARCDRPGVGGYPRGPAAPARGSDAAVDVADDHRPPADGPGGRLHCDSAVAPSAGLWWHPGSRLRPLRLPLLSEPARYPAPAAPTDPPGPRSAI